MTRNREGSPYIQGKVALLSAVALVALATPALAQSASAQSASAPLPPAGAATTQVTPSVPTSQVDASQSSANPSSPSTETGPEIIVTALKRGTRLQETPLSISAVTSESIANAGIQSIADLHSQVPSLNFVDGGPSNRRVVIRGIYAVGEPTVGVYYDETPVTGVVGASNDAGGSTPELRLFDVERVEVLRGPQGTLYGSGSMGGTLRVIYKKPVDHWEAAFDGSLSGTQHGGANQEINGVVNVPLVSDLAAVRVVGYYKDNSGYIDNTFLNVKNINNEQDYGGRADLRLTPLDGWTIDAAAYLNHTTDDTPSWILQDGKYQTDARTRQQLKDDVKLYSLTSVYDFGPVTATGVVSYMNRNFESQSDTSRFIQAMRTPAGCRSDINHGTADCTPAQLTSFYDFIDDPYGYGNAQTTSSLFPQQTMHALTAEGRLSSSGHGPLNWTVGGFYSRRDTHVANPQVNVDPQSGYIIYPLEFDTVRYIGDVLKQTAAFADVSYDITRKLNLTGGVRYFKYNRDVSGHTDVASVLVGAQITPLTQRSSSEDGEVYKANLSYKFTPNVMTYFNFSQGFRPGGVNQTLGLATALQPYGSDHLNDYEVGVKTTSFHHALTVDADVYQIDWTNIQVSGQTPNGAFSFITNAGAARIRGVELESTLNPVHGLSIMGNFSYTDARLTENQTNGQVRAPGLKGDRLPYVPKWNAGASAQYTWPLSDTLDGLVRADYSYVGSSYSDFRPPATNTRHIPAYDLVNARIGVEGKDGWGVYLFCNNLFDSTAILRESASAIASANPPGPANLTIVTSAQPRTVGINLRKTF